MTNPTNLSDYPPLPEPWSANSTIKCAACGKAYVPKAIGTVAVGSMFLQPVQQHACTCGGTSFKATIGYDSPSPAKYTDAQMFAFVDADRKSRSGGRAWRPEVVAFANAMERKLRDNDWKGGWKEDASGALMVRVHEEFREFTTAHLQYPRDTERYRADLLNEGADVANMIMMVVDVCGALAPSGASPAPAPTDEALHAIYQDCWHQGTFDSKFDWLEYGRRCAALSAPERVEQQAEPASREWSRLVELAGEQFGDDDPPVGPEWAQLVATIASRPSRT